MSIYGAVTASDTTVYAPALRAVWVSVAGNVAILGETDSVAVTLPNVPVGFLLFPYPVQKIMQTNTTATVAVGCQTG
jgi:hypothetical protein